MNKYIKNIIIGLVFYNIILSIGEYFLYDSKYDTVISIGITYLKYNGAYFLLIIWVYILNKIALKFEK